MYKIKIEEVIQLKFCLKYPVYMYIKIWNLWLYRPWTINKNILNYLFFVFFLNWYKWNILFFKSNIKNQLAALSIWENLFPCLKQRPSCMGTIAQRVNINKSIFVQPKSSPYPILTEPRLFPRFSFHSSCTFLHNTSGQPFSIL